MPKSHMRKKDGTPEKIDEVAPEMVNLLVGENMISFGTGG